MSREQLLAFTTEVSRLAAAGVATAMQSDILRKRSTYLRELAKQIPALGTLADSVDDVLRATAKNAATAFLDLLVKTRRLRVSLAGSGMVGDLSELPPSGPWQTPLDSDSAENYTQTIMSGYTIHGLKAAVKDQSIADLRLLDPMLAALEGQNNIADFLSDEALPIFGEALTHELRETIDLRGGKVDARRLKVLCRVNGEIGLQLAQKAVVDGSDEVRSVALQEISRLADAQTVEKLGLEYIKSKAKANRLAAINLLAGGKSDIGLTALLDALNASDKESRERAAAAIARYDNPKTTPRLLELLAAALADVTKADENLKAAKKAEKATPAGKPAKGTKTTKAPNAAKGKTAEKEKFDDVAKATKAVVEAEETTVALLNILVDRKERNKGPIATALLPLVDHESSTIRDAAVEAFAKIGAATPEVIPTFLKLLDEAKPTFLAKILKSLADFTTAKQEAVLPKLFAMVRSDTVSASNKELCLNIIINHVKKQQAEIFKLLEELLLGKEEKIRPIVVEAMFKIGKDCKSLLIPLTTLMVREKENIVPTARAQIYHLLDPEGTIAIGKLVDLLDVEKPTVRTFALYALAPYGKAAKAHLPKIEELKKDRSQNVKIAAEFAASQINRR